MQVPGIPIRVLMVALAAFCLGTICWIAWGLETPGDYFANGSVMVDPTLIAAVLAGLFVGWKARMRVVISCATIASLCFWLFVRDGWWAHAPPFGPAWPCLSLAVETSR
jgi:hypothetical protein